MKTRFVVEISVRQVNTAGQYDYADHIEQPIKADISVVAETAEKAYKDADLILAALLGQP